MKKSVLFAVPTYKKLQMCADLVQSVPDETDIAIYNRLIIDNSGGEVKRQFPDLESRCMIATPVHNIGVARSFNLALHIASVYEYDYVIISNDDLVLRPDTLDTLVAAAIEHDSDYKKFIFCTSGGGLNAFSLFLAPPTELIKHIGFFEVAYFSYLEDNDMHYRLQLYGTDLVRVPGCDVESHAVSATIQEFTGAEVEHFHRYRAKGTHEYLRKWGGGPHAEVYQTPYDSGLDSTTWHRVYYCKEDPINLPDY